MHDLTQTHAAAFASPQMLVFLKCLLRALKGLTFWQGQVHHLRFALKALTSTILFMFKSIVKSQLTLLQCQKSIYSNIITNAEHIFRADLALWCENQILIDSNFPLEKWISYHSKCGQFVVFYHFDCIMPVFWS